MKLALGTVQFGLPYGVSNLTGQTPLHEAERIVELARSSGISLLDTAMAYGDSEARLGKIGVDSFKVVTKLPLLPENCPEPKKWAEEQVQGSLQRLGQARLYGLLLHNPAQLLSPNGQHLFEVLQGFKARGLVEKIGISIYLPSELDALFPLFPFDIVQSPFNPVDRGLMASGWMQKLHAEGIEIHVRSVFLQGLLLLPADQIPAKFFRWSPLWKKWHDWLYQNGISPQAACLAFAKSVPEIDQILVGVETRHQLEEILTAFHLPTPDSFPSIESTDPDLINPSQWSKL
jgi:aryl-alcohol dehydrogenase-like predicted oxidoreductase